MTARRRLPAHFYQDDRPASASELIDALFKKHPVGNEMRHYRLVSRWAELVGPRIAARTRPQVELLDRGVLPVIVANSAWMHELSFAKGEMVERINQGLGGRPLLTDLRFFLRNRGTSTNSPLNQSRQRNPRVAAKTNPLPVPASGAALAQIHHETRDIEDAELRAIIRETRRRLNC